MATLYGSAKVLGPDEKYIRKCYFFRNSEFYRLKNSLDGAVAAYLSGSTVTVHLCLNPYSENCEALRISPLAEAFSNGLVDPVAEEAEGSAYIVDPAIDRGNSSAVLQHLQSKYRRPRLMEMPMQLLSVSFVALDK